MTKDIPYLSVRNLSKAYPGVEALKGVSLEVLSGKVHALVGENGAGKSTFIKILAGAEQPDPGGEIDLGGARYAPQNPREALDYSVSTIYQIMNLLPDRTIMHNVFLGKEPASRGCIDHQVLRQNTAQVLQSLNAGHLAPEMLVRDLKVGEKQVIEIAKALVHESKLLIMDEPTASLNQAEARALFDNIRKLRADGVTIIYVSHRLDEIFALADTVTVLRDGQHILTQPVRELTRTALIEAMIGRRLDSVFPPRRDAQGDEVLRVEDLSSGKVLKDINLSLRRGEVLAVAGLSGSGKEDLGRALFGVLPIDRGRVWVGGKPYKPSPVKAIHKRLTLLPDDRKTDGLLQELNIRRNISLSVLGTRTSGRLGVIKHRLEQQVAQEQIEALDIKTPSMEQYVVHLSGGNQQKVVLGRCLAVDPEIFILMEPTQGIDVGVKFEIYQLITDQAASGKAILLISSELAEVSGLAHRVLVMHEGRIVANLNSEETDQEEILRYALGEKAPQS